VQDAPTGQMIGGGIERGGLYHLEGTVQQGKAVLAHGSKERLLRTWHRRLGHPSIGYLEKLFPSLVGYRSSFKCKTCIRAC
jgi:gag-pre-integrase-like protein